MKGKSNKAKARGEEQSALPGLEPSPAWQKMKSTPKPEKRSKVHRVDAGPGHPSWQRNVVPGKCTCGDQLFEDNNVDRVVPLGDGKYRTEYKPESERKKEGVKVNPWIFGHAYWCSMFIPKCEDCGQTGGTHTPQCSFWKLHPNITPF